MSASAAPVMDVVADVALAQHPPTASKASGPASGAASSLPSTSTLSASLLAVADSSTSSEIRSSSKGRKRLTVTLGSLLSGGKKDKQKSEPRREGSASQPSGHAPDAAALGVAPDRRSRSSSRSQSIDETDGPGALASPSPTSAHDTQALRPLKPPVSLPGFFRHRLSSSSTHQVRSSASSPDLESTSPVAPAPAPRLSLEAIVPRRSIEIPSLRRLMQALSLRPNRRAFLLRRGDGGAQLRLRGSLAETTKAKKFGGSAAPFSPISPRRPSDTAFTSPALQPPAVANSPEKVASATQPLLSLPTALEACSAPIDASRPSSPTSRPRRLTRNIEGLSLSDLGPRNAPGPSPATQVVEATAAPPAASTVFAASPLSVDSSSLSRSSTNTRERLYALPRLLSSDAIPDYVASTEQEQEPDDGETETDTEAEEPSEDEGDRYASADDGPSTSRTITPAQTPRMNASILAFDSPSSSSARTPRIPSLTGLSALSAAGSAASASDVPAAPSWITFSPFTPTPSTVRTARPLPPSDAADASYFDLPRPTASFTGRTPLVPPKTPLAPMSISEVARGKRPALQEDVAGTTQAAARLSASTSSVHPDQRDEVVIRQGLYRLRSHSEVALMSPSMVDSDEEPVGTGALAGLDPIWQACRMYTASPAVITTPASPPKPAQTLPQVPSLPIPGPPPTPFAAAGPSSSQHLSVSPTQPRNALLTRPTPANARIHRPRSMYELRDAPPAYSSIARAPGIGPQQPVQPREEEGKEGLPAYTCAIHIEGFMPRKMEFTAPGVQAKDRAWKRQYVVLHGTSIKVYKYDLRTHPIPGEVDWSVIPADIAGHDGPPPLHFHEGEYGVIATTTSHRFPLSITDAKAKAKNHIITSATASSQNQLLRHYSLQNAESGLAADYIKRRHVVRVRAEGEQFLLQAKDDRGVIDLIEALQAATNVALDLDARPLPKFITLPRRRRRRRLRPDPNANGTAAPGATVSAPASGTITNPSNGTAGSGGSRDLPDRMGDMLAEEQNAYTARSGGTVM
ncbi:SPOSA6832_04237 [Sporobolomyces salmonicolor]|uniref:SPOSA6832_04237-mRNA-1:cds n=1 Tax=Sporidiobolus salmonicolor TaxID=5005 RepID=A0A0D6ER29_SPOSA|nr:SPOSA6832_04237 [Sporobolomyces salmonicolor]